MIVRFYPGARGGMDLRYTQDELTFRDKVSAFLDASLFNNDWSLIDDLDFFARAARIEIEFNGTGPYCPS
jgi:hypothetical protein